MNNLTPYNTNLPGAVTWQGQAAPRTERSSLRYWVGVTADQAWRAVGIGAVLFVAVVGIVSQIPPTYYAEGSVLVQPARANLAQVGETQSGLPVDTSAVDTEVELLKSRALSETVIQKLGLDKDPEFSRPPSSKWSLGFSSQWPFVLTHAPASAEDETTDPSARVVDAVQRRTSVRRIGLTYVVRMGFSAGTPAKAEKITNALIDSYLARQITQKVDAVAQANVELDTSMDKLRQNALDSEARLQEYKNANNLLSIQGATMAEGEVSALNQQIAKAKADRIEKEARRNSALDRVEGGSGGADIAATLGSDTIKELRKKEAETSAQVAQLSVLFKPDYPELQRAQAQINDIHQQIQREIGRILSSLTTEAGAASQREASLLASRSEAQNELGANNRARVGLVALEQRAGAAKKIYEGYLNRASEVAAARSLQQADATVNYRAAVSATHSPDMRLAAAFAALLAMVGGAATILLPEFWNRRLRSRMDIEHEIGMPLAAVLPDFASIARADRRLSLPGPADYLSEQPFTAFAEAFRNLRAFLMLSDRSGPAKIVAITSALPREGKSMTSFCLARTLAVTGAKVVLVDCDVRQRGITKMIGEPTVGIVEVIEKKLPLADALVRDSKSGAWILPAADGPIPHDLFGTEEADNLFRKLAEEFDHVILDTPPLLGVADARILAAKADKVLYLVQWNKTPSSTAQSAVDILQECGAKVTGAILAQVDVRQQARYGYGDSSDYFRHYQRYYAADA